MNIVLYKIIIHQSIGKSTKRKYADTDDSTSERDSDHSDNTDEDQENEHETDPWASLKMEAMTKSMPEFQELTETFTADGLEEEEARDKAYLTILPKLRKDLQSIYLNRLLRIAQMKKDPRLWKRKTPLQMMTILTQKKPWRLLLIKESF